MRILHVVAFPLYSGPVPGVVGLALAQRALGHEVWVAIDRKRGAFNPYEEAAAPRLEPHHLAPPWPLTLCTKSTPFQLWRDRRTLRALVQGGALDVVHAHMSHDHTLLALAQPGRGSVLRVRSVHAERSLGARIGQRLLNRRADAWITRSEVHRARLIESCALPANRVAAIPGGVDAQAFAPPTAADQALARARFDLPAAAFVISHAALITDRGQRELVTAVASLPDPRPFILFIGRGEEEDSLRAHVAASGMTPWVRFAGYLQGDALLTGYAAADAAFVAQPGNDASARAALEAMAMGLPVLAVQSGSLAELVTAERGFPVTSRTPDTLVAGIRALMTDPVERAHRAAAGRVHVVRERSFAREAEQTVAHYTATFTAPDARANR